MWTYPRKKWCVALRCLLWASGFCCCAHKGVLLQCKHAVCGLTVSLEACGLGWWACTSMCTHSIQLCMWCAAFRLVGWLACLRGGLQPFEVQVNKPCNYTLHTGFVLPSDLRVRAASWLLHVLTCGIEVCTNERRSIV